MSIEALDHERCMQNLVASLIVTLIEVVHQGYIGDEPIATAGQLENTKDNLCDDICEIIEMKKHQMGLDK